MIANENVKWAGTLIVLAGFLVATVLAFADVRSQASYNAKRIDAIENRNTEILNSVRQIDRRQVLIMSKLDINDPRDR